MPSTICVKWLFFNTSTTQYIWAVLDLGTLNFYTTFPLIFFLNIDTPKPSVLHIKFKTSFIS